MTFDMYTQLFYNLQKFHLHFHNTIHHILHRVANTQYFVMSRLKPLFPTLSFTLVLLSLVPSLKLLIEREKKHYMVMRT